jgi:aminoglycoside phosphotransferase family enzyme/predicted kinase
VVITEDQREVIEFLADPATHGGDAVKRIDTHASIVFLAGQRAWKLKRAVRYDYLDYSSADRRRVMCEAEVRINRRTAPMLYRGVVPVTRGADAHLELGGSGTAVDWVVEMARFDEAHLLDGMAARHELSIPLATAIGTAIAAFHASAEVRTDRGGAAGIALVIDGNEQALAGGGAGAVDPDTWRALIRDTRARLDADATLLDVRRAGGRVRQCHGDLHLRNIVMIGSSPTLFDAVEFNDDFAVVDVLYDLAFLLMDLVRRKLPLHANAVWNAYMAAAADEEGVSLMPLFLSCRAAIRAKTSASAATLAATPAERARLEGVAREYAALARTLLRPSAPCVIAIGGLSGSGKSTLAAALAGHLGAPPGALVIRSDVIRKRLAGVDPTVRLDAARYASDMTARVYRELIERTVAAARAGTVAVADATFLEPEQRRAIEQAAHDARAPFVGIWLDAPEACLVDRVSKRRGDASDADVSVVRHQIGRSPGAINWARLDTSGGADAVTGEALAIVRRLAAEAVRDDGG